VDVKDGRWDSDQIIDELLATQKMYNVNVFTFEAEKIDKAIGPFLMREQMRRGIYLNIVTMTPGQSKIARAASIQGMHKSGAIRYDREASWFPSFHSELLTVSGSGPRGKHDDKFDSFAYLGTTINQYWDAQSDEELEQEEYEQAFEDYSSQGRCYTTGY
jgi:predicted phage terminase large subunit-like protein